MLSNIIFTLTLITAIGAFFWQLKQIFDNINLGHELADYSDNKKQRLLLMLKLAFGQSKMTVRPIAGFLHILVYAGFIIINIEMLEIILDGILGTHRILAPHLGNFYNFLIASFEYLAIAVIVACVIFLLRRNVIRLQRFSMKDLKGFPAKDANLILTVEIVLMIAFLLMNAADFQLQANGANPKYGSFPVSQYLANILSGLNNESLHLTEQTAWWVHILGVFAFLNYLPVSKHLHILLAFPNTYYSNLKPKGQFYNIPSVTQEVKLMLDPSLPAPEQNAPLRFGAKDVQDLFKHNLLNAYSCTECGRCTSECPANQTGKLLSPRKIMMATRDRIEEVGKNIRKNGNDYTDGKSLLGDYITPEEIWACTTCNACTNACPINIDPLSIIMQMRQYLVMEQAAPPTEFNNLFSNIENNGAPWQFSPADRLNWAKE